MNKRILFYLLLSLISLQVCSQNAHTLDASNVKVASVTKLPMEGRSPDGTMLSVNNKYFVKDGRPWFPLMGEFHFNRYPAQYWEEEIVKMKMAGLSIVATYVFWNAHENPKGVWNWKDDLDLRHFISLCAKHKMYVWLRIGPWSHGEQLYGGFPEWIEKMHGKRTNDPAYLSEAKKLFMQIGEQTKGLFFQDGGPVIGVQLENEYATGQADHISTLRQMALDAHIRPVIFSVTANTVFHNDRMEVIPLQGAYPYRGWESGGGKATKDFLYGNDQWIMETSLGKVFYDVTKYPRGLCEQGCGSQQTYENRFVVEPEVVEAHLQNQVGRGMNFVGYYMFQGGTQMPGLKEPGLPESYDFQAPLSEFGEVKPSCQHLKLLHSFINDYGQELAPMPVVEPMHPVVNELNTDSLRYIVRTDGKAGFVFLCNTQVRVTMPDKNVALSVKLKDETIKFPSFILKGQTSPLLAFNTRFNSGMIKYVLAQPMARFINDKEEYFIYAEMQGVPAEIAIEGKDIAHIEADGWQTSKDNKSAGLYKRKDGRLIKLTGKDGSKTNIIVLTRKEAEHSWRVSLKGKEYMLISNADVEMMDNRVLLKRRDTASFELSVFPPIKPAVSVNGKVCQPVTEKAFSIYRFKLTENKPDIDIKTIGNDKVAFSVPAKLPAQVSDVFLQVNYLGSSALLQHNGATVTDNLFNGTEWTIGLKRYAGKRLEIQVEPWQQKITGVEPAIVQKAVSARSKIESVTIHPQYVAALQFK